MNWLTFVFRWFAHKKFQTNGEKFREEVHHVWLNDNCNNIEIIVYYIDEPPQYDSPKKNKQTIQNPL